MNHIFLLIVGVLQITLLDLVLSGDNVGVIALATKNLPPIYAKKASIVGISFAIGMRIFFACLVTEMLQLQSIPIKLIGGLILVKITWSLINSNNEEEEEEANVKIQNKFWGAVGSIVIADATMSLDNVLAIASAANGQIYLIIFGILLNIPIIFFGSQFVVYLMKKYSIVVYIGGAILAHTSFKMIFEDKLIAGFIPHSIAVGFPWVMALATLLYGVYIISKTSNEKEKEPSIVRR